MPAESTYAQVNLLGTKNQQMLQYGSTNYGPYINGPLP